MIIDNELLNRLVREGEGMAVLSSSPAIPEIVDETGKLLQASEQVPLLDALRAQIACSSRLRGASSHPEKETVDVVDKATLQRLIHSIVRVELPQRDMLDDAPLPIKIEAGSKEVDKSYKTAERLAALVKEKPRLPMEDFVDVLKNSPNPAITENFLADAGPGQPGFIGPNGPMAAFQSETPSTLPTRKPIDLKIRVWSVKEKEGYARVEIKEFLDERAKRVLPHYASELSLNFDADSVQCDDLMAAQYLRREIRVKVAAECATHERHSRKTKLTLVRLLESRTALDRLHGLARQIELQFEQDADASADARNVQEENESSE
jgi:hypothetical protein